MRKYSLSFFNQASGIIVYDDLTTAGCFYLGCRTEESIVESWKSTKEKLVIDYKRKSKEVGAFGTAKKQMNHSSVPAHMSLAGGFWLML
jgi:hypothetical protein